MLYPATRRLLHLAMTRRCLSSLVSKGTRQPTATKFLRNTQQIHSTIPSPFPDDHDATTSMNMPSQEFAYGCSFLHQVALGDAEGVKQMHAQKPDLLNFRDYDRRCALHVAASEGHLAITQYLVEQGSPMNRSDRWGGSPLDDAQRHRHLEVFDYLREKGALFGSPNQSTCFITAASEGDLEEVMEYIKFGSVDLNKGDYDKRTALHLAAGEGHAEVVKVLCENGADVNAKDRWGNRPLDDATNCRKEDCSDVVEVLKQHGAKMGAGPVAEEIGQDVLLDLMHEYGQVRDGVLSLDWHDVKRLVQGTGEEPDDEVVRKLFDVADLDGNGVITPDEFLEHSDLFLDGRPARIILVVGGPGSGKGILSERLVKECGVVHISSGDLLRDEVAQGTALGKQVEDIMKGGGLVSSAIMVSLMQKRMKDHPGKRILLDGFPRSRENAEDLVKLCGIPELALHLDCDDTVLLERIIKRGASGERSDDNFETGLNRVRTFHKYHDMTLAFLKDQHVPVINLDCSTTPEGVWQQLRAIGKLMRSSVKLPTDNGNGQQSAYSNR